MPSRRRATRLSAAAFVAVMLIAPAAGAQTAAGHDDPVTVEFGGATVTVLGRSVYLFPEPDEVSEPDTTIGARVDAPVVGEQTTGVTHSSDDPGDPAAPVLDAGFAAACDVAAQGDPVTYCETTE